MNSKALTLLLLSALNFQVAVAESGFAASCQYVRVSQPNNDLNPNVDYYHTTLYGDYREKVGTYTVSMVINLNYCIAHDNGNMIPRPK